MNLTTIIILVIKFNNESKVELTPGISHTLTMTISYTISLPLHRASVQVPV